MILMIFILLRLINLYLFIIIKKNIVLVIRFDEAHMFHFNNVV